MPPKKKPEPDKIPETAESHTHGHQLMPKHGVQNQTRTKPELWFAAKSQYLYDQSSHLEAKLTCTTAIGRQAGSRGDSSFCGQGRG